MTHINLVNVKNYIHYVETVRNYHCAFKQTFIFQITAETPLTLQQKNTKDVKLC